ncbi:hypothetical protein [Parapedobacter sp. 10938]|uniref:hypothetical protein n=1 Tax=Parapedobacter flavus TaxID=3110225 RepID=UPI002DBE37D5|nr:hypothetical protein [Parapedobacter sp. 10938]MEC3879188.1 hypothetical protein [Parapedobacter sp. 10938]
MVWYRGGCVERGGVVMVPSQPEESEIYRRSTLPACAQLQYLNLSSTAIGNDGVNQLRGLPALTRVYLFGTNVTREAIADMQQS